MGQPKKSNSQKQRKKKAGKKAASAVDETVDTGGLPDEPVVGVDAVDGTEEGKPKRGKPGPKGKPDGFRAECYKLIEKGIDRNTLMLVVKGRHSLGDGTRIFVGETFKANLMDARKIKAAMNMYYIMPADNAPKPNERRDHYVERMMGIYEPDTPLSKCKKK